MRYSADQGGGGGEGINEHAIGHIRTYIHNQIFAALCSAQDLEPALRPTILPTPLSRNAMVLSTLTSGHKDSFLNFGVKKAVMHVESQLVLQNRQMNSS